MASVAELALVKDASSTAVDMSFRVECKPHIGHRVRHDCVCIAAAGQNLRGHSEQIHCIDLQLEKKSSREPELKYETQLYTKHGLPC